MNDTDGEVLVTMKKTDKMMGYCGLLCADCSALLATQSGDLQTMQREAQKWRKLFKRDDMDVEYITCDGCKSRSGRLCGHCSLCEIRKCALNRQVEHCGFCSDFPCAALISLHTQLSEYCTMKDFFGYEYDPVEVLQTFHDRKKQ